MRSGRAEFIRSLGVRLPPRHRLLAIMYLGLTETRAFTPRIRKWWLISARARWC